MTTRDAVRTFVFWVAVALAFDLVIWLQDASAGAEFFGAWAMEEALSLDNLFMFYFIFTVFQTPHKLRPRVLRWGIIGVVLMRGAIILGGTALIGVFKPLLYAFAVFLFWAATRIFFFSSDDDRPDDEKKRELEQNWLVRIARRYFAFDTAYHGHHFMVKRDGKKHGTLLLLVLIAVEGTDIPFAFDSLPAAMAISQRFWIVMSSNLLAVLGLRAIYFLIENMRERFAYMQYGIGLLLGFAAVKIVVSTGFGIDLPIAASLGIIGGVIATTIGYTLWRSRGEPFPKI